MTARAVGLPVLLAALLLGGCGDSQDEPAPGRSDTGTTAAPDTATATAPAEPPVTVTEAVPAPTPQTVTATTPATTPTAPESEPGGAGDEEGIRVTARFTLAAGPTLSPQGAQVPAFLNFAVAVENTDTASHRLEVGDRGSPLPAGRTTTLLLPGRAATQLPILVDGTQVGLLRVVAETP